MIPGIALLVWMALLGRAAPACVQVLDRVMASFGNEAITQSDAEREYRFELFLDGKSLSTDPDSATLRHVCERLVEQKLLVKEAAFDTGISAEAKSGAWQALADVRKRFQDQDAYLAALHDVGMSEQQVLDRLIEQQRILRMVDQRFRPIATPDASEIEKYYRASFAEPSKNGRPAPPLAEVESQIREVLVQKKINELLAKWLEELKTSRQVQFHED